jgi:uncharacterized protein (DUF2147 family)
MRILTTTITATLFCLIFSTVQADTMPVEGQWRTIDDDTGEAMSIVRIWVENDEMQGQIVTILDPAEPDPRCTECRGQRNNQPIEGMTFLWGLSRDDDEWTGGRILDPATGREYRARVRLIENGEKLEVRGFVGIALIGRTQIWERVE